MRLLSTSALIIVNLTGCSLLPPKVVEVKIPYPVSCIEAMPVKPDFISDANLIKMLDGNFVTALHIDRLKRISYIDDLEAVLSACDYMPQGVK